MLIVVERAMGNAVDVAAIRRKFLSIRDQLDERGRRLFVAAEVRALGRGGLAAVARATGVPAGKPLRVSTHDFADPELGKVVPYGVYDIADNSGWVSVGIDHDTAEFAVNAIRNWWEKVGRARYPGATRLMITADGGGSNGARVRLWKIELQKLADEIGIEIAVCHYPPGTSKWNKIEHRLFCHITRNWQARPLTSRLAVVELIAATSTKTGLTVACELDDRLYAAGIKVPDADMDALNIVRADFHPEWNYTIAPRKRI
jgi:hypothetical protein